MLEGGEVIADALVSGTPWASVGAGVGVATALAILAVAVGTAVASISGSAFPTQATDSMSVAVKRSIDKSLYSITGKSLCRIR